MDAVFMGSLSLSSAYRGCATYPCSEPPSMSLSSTQQLRLCLKAQNLRASLPFPRGECPCRPMPWARQHLGLETHLTWVARPTHTLSRGNDAAKTQVRHNIPILLVIHDLWSSHSMTTELPPRQSTSPSNYHDGSLGQSGPSSKQQKGWGSTS